MATSSFGFSSSIFAFISIDHSLHPSYPHQVDYMSLFTMAADKLHPEIGLARKSSRTE
jgi:hypothetical protein